MTDEQLAALIADDEFGLLVVKSKPTPADSEEERLLSKFEEILNFVEINEEPPAILSEDRTERLLAVRLQAIRKNPNHRKTLERFDEFGLLKEEPEPEVQESEPILEPAPGEIPQDVFKQQKPPENPQEKSQEERAPQTPADPATGPKTTQNQNLQKTFSQQPQENQNPVEEAPPATIDDLLADPFFDDLSMEGMEIFELKHIPKIVEVESPDYVAQRKPCLDFDQFEDAFRKCQSELRAGARSLIEFRNEQQIEAGKFYVLRGILLQVAEIGERVEKNGKYNARLRCIFENGTESDMFLRSLSSELYKDGRRVTETDENVIKNMVVGADDKQSGFIYVLRSLSPDPKIQAIPNLHKIGLARQSIQGRIQNAASEPTYLMAPVKLVASYDAYNVNLPKLESLLHRFFDHAAVIVQLTDTKGYIQTPKEWFSVSLPVIRQAVELLISGQITKYRFDPDSGVITRI